MEYSGRPVRDYDNAITKAHKWLKSLQRPDGSVDGDVSLTGYCVQPVGFRAMGDPVSANRCLSFIKNRFLKERGLLLDEREFGQGHAYNPAWTVISSHLWERFDISSPVSEWILQFQDPETGGLFGTADDAKKGRGIIDFETTAIAGIALVYAGKLGIAEKVGRYLLKLHKEQPDTKNRYLFGWETGRGIITDYDQTEELRFAVVKGKEKQAYHLSGLFIILLTDLYLTTGKKEYLDAAKQQFHFATNDNDGIWHTGLACKLCWGSSLLYQATGEYKFFEAAKRIGDHLIGLQTEGGTYRYPELFNNFEDQSLTYNLNVSLQFTWYVARVRWILPE